MLAAGKEEEKSRGGNIGSATLACGVLAADDAPGERFAFEPPGGTAGLVSLSCRTQVPQTYHFS